MYATQPIKNSSRLYKFNDTGKLIFICSAFYTEKSPIEGVHFPVDFSIVGYDEIFWKPTNKNRIIRYIPGEQSIFADEQTDPTSKANIQVQYIHWISGVLEVHPQETLLLEFLRYSNHNGYCENRMPKKEIFFIPFQPNMKAEENMDKEKLIFEALKKMFEMVNAPDGWYNLESYAQVLGIRTTDGHFRTQEELTKYIKNNPQDFLNGVDSPAMKKKYFVLEAIKHGILVHLKPQNAAHTLGWANAGLIVAAPVGQDAVDYLVNNSEDQFKATFDEIKKQVGATRLYNEAKEVPVVEEEVKDNEPKQKSSHLNAFKAKPKSKNED